MKMNERMQSNYDAASGLARRVADCLMSCGLERAVWDVLVLDEKHREANTKADALDALEFMIEGFLEIQIEYDDTSVSIVSPETSTMKRVVLGGGSTITKAIQAATQNESEVEG